MRCLLDTSICVELIRGRSAELTARLKRRTIGSVGISSITLAELQYGVAKSSDPPRNTIALAHVVAPLVVLPFDDQAAAVYGQMRADLERLGQRIGSLDMLIAAHALALGVTLVTNNQREFRRVPGLKVENWLTTE
jgi:tRNA(fMet)-specific endonuclease VapC